MQAHHYVLTSFAEIATLTTLVVKVAILLHFINQGKYDVPLFLTRPCPTR